MSNDEQNLEYIGNLIADGFTSGYYPYWKLSLAGIHPHKLNDVSLEHISKLVSDGYVAGEVTEECQNRVNRGWWKLQT